MVFSVPSRGCILSGIILLANSNAVKASTVTASISPVTKGTSSINNLICSFDNLLSSLYSDGKSDKEHPTYFQIVMLVKYVFNHIGEIILTIKEQIDSIKTKISMNHNVGTDFIDDIFDLIDLASLKKYDENKIKYKYTDDEYGKTAKDLHLNYGLKYAYPGDAGIDLPIVLSEEDRKHDGLQIFPNERAALHTGFIMEFPIGHYGRIVHRSSTEKKHRLRVIEGIIDDYRGEILVQVHNPNTFPIKVYHGDRLGQLIIVKTCPFKLEEAQSLRESKRGSNGFGSSGK